jgi:hypothetical protein
MRNQVFYIFDANSPLARTGQSVRERDDLGRMFAMEVIRAQPGDYLALVGRSVETTFSWADPFGQTADVRFRQPEPMSDLARQVGRRYQVGTDPGPTYLPSAVRFLGRYQDVAWVPGAVWLVVVALGIVALVVGRDPDRRGLRSAVVLTVGTATALLLVAGLSSFPQPRYRVPAIPELSLAIGICGTLLLNRWRAG